MKKAITIVQLLIRLTWLVLLALGILFWTGRDLELVQFHEMIGAVFVLALWALAYFGLREAASRIMAAVLFAWSFVVLVFGMIQTGILTGSAHWLVETLHLLIGVVAIGLAEALGAGIKRRLSDRGLAR